MVEAKHCNMAEAKYRTHFEWLVDVLPPNLLQRLDDIKKHYDTAITPAIAVFFQSINLLLGSRSAQLRNSAWPSFMVRKFSPLIQIRSF